MYLLSVTKVCRATSFGSPILGLDSFCEFVLPKYSSGLLTNSSSHVLFSSGSSVEGLTPASAAAGGGPPSYVSFEIASLLSFVFSILICGVW